MENFIFCAVRHSKKLKLKLHFGFKLAIWSIQKSIPQSIAYKYSLLMTYSCQNFQLLLFHIILPISFGSRIFFAKKKQSKKLESSNACLWTYQACIVFFFFFLRKQIIVLELYLAPSQTSTMELFCHHRSLTLHKKEVFH